MTITLPDELAAQMSTLLPEDERDGFAATAIADALEARRRAADADGRLVSALRADLGPERDSAECVAAVNEALAEMQDGLTISFEEEKARWQQQKAALLTHRDARTA